jgi:hypothetical protein
VPDKSAIETLDTLSRDTMFYLLDIMDGITGGAFKRGYRIPTAKERIAEWDNLAPEQTDTLRANMGDEWFYKQAAEIETLRGKTDIGVPDAVGV